MNKYLLSFSLGAVLFLSACGDGTSEESDVTSEDSNTSEQASEEVETEENIEEEVTEEGDDSEVTQVGETITNEVGEITVVSRTDDVGIFESGPIKLTIEKANGNSMIVNSNYVDMLGGEELEYIQVDMTVENTSEDHITFFASQATMTTSTGEQIEPDMFLSDHIDAEFLGAITKSGTSFYILENSKAEDVESIKLFYDEAIDENWENVGEKIEVEIPLNK